MKQPLRITKWVTIPSRGITTPLATYAAGISTADHDRAAENDLPVNDNGIDWPWVTVDDFRAMTGDPAAGWHYRTN